MSVDEVRLSNCEGKEKLTAKVAKDLKVRYAKRGRPKMVAYKCRFCSHWHMGTENFLKAERYK